MLMNTIQKPNDILIATLSAPQANVIDLLQNNITAANTSLLMPEEYKQTPFVQQRYTKNGVFNENAFNQDYLLAYQKYSDLAMVEAADNLNEYLTYAPQDRFAPTNAKTWDTSATYKAITNPLQQQYSVQGINTKSAPTVTPEEAAQSNFIFDPKTGKFTDKTPESLNIFEKALGQTLVYAKWEEDGLHINSKTGLEETHRKGDWKTDSNGNYYTEYLGDRELLDQQVVSLSDILTDEGTLLNRMDFFDSDGYDKSTFGTIMKSTAAIIPYLIPGFREYYAGFTVIAGLASVLPTFYKSFESIMGGGSELESSSVTAIENWFRKYNPSKSYKGRESFWTLESMGELVADVWAQTYQQRAAAGAAEWFAKKPKLLNKNASLQEVAKYKQELAKFEKGYNRLQSALSLGYMSLISTADMYNETLKAGYDKDTAGWAALMSAAGMFGIMNFNETARGIGTWMLDKTTGFQKEAERGVIHKLIREKMDDVAASVKQMKGGNKQPMINTWVDIRKATKRKLHDIFVIGGEDVWKNMIVEGVEEVTEEIIQDSIKGIIDAMASTGIINQEGSFGGWSNVFSKQGLERYLATFFGGALGGGLFSMQNKLDQKFYDSPSGKDMKYTIRRAILDGRVTELFNELEKHKRFYNNRQGVEIGEINGQKIYLTGDKTKSQADIIYERVLGELRHEVLTIARLTEGLSYDPRYSFVHAALSDSYEKSGLQENYILPQWKRLVEDVAQASNTVQKLNEEIISLSKENKPTSEKEEELKQATEKFEELNGKLKNWLNGENFAEFTLGSLIYLNKELSDNLMNLSIEDYAKNVLNVDYNNIPKNSNWTKETIKADYDLYKRDLTKDNLVNTLPKIIDVLKKTIPGAAKTVSEYVKNSNNKRWLKIAKQDVEGTAEDYHYENLLEYLSTNPKYWTLSDKLNFDLAKELESKKIINFEGRKDKEVISELINYLAIHSGVNVWNRQNIDILLKKVNDILRDRPTDNPFSIRLNELEAEQSEKTKEESQVDVSFGELSAPDYSNLTDEEFDSLQNVKLSSIIDLVDINDEYIDEELYHLLEITLNTEVLQRHSDTINYLLDSLVTANGLSLEQALQNNIFKYIKLVTGEGTEEYFQINKEIPLDFSGINKDNILSYIPQLKQLVKSLSSIEQNLIEGKFFEVYFINEQGETIDSLESASDLIDPDNENSVLNIISSLIQTVEQGAILPEELESKWNVIKGKQRVENPLLSLIKDLSHKFGMNNDSLVNWLWDKESKIHAGNYILSDQEQLDIDTLARVVTFANSLLACMQEEGSTLTGEINLPQFGLKSIPLSFNGVLRNFYKLYGNGEAAKMFPVFSAEELSDTNLTLTKFLEKLYTISNLNAEKWNSDNQADQQARQYYLQNTVKELNTKVLEIGQSKLPFSLCNPEIKDNEPENSELYIAQQLQSFRQRVKKDISNGKFTEEEFIDSLIKAYPESFMASNSVVDDAGFENNSDKLNFDTLIDAFAVDYGELYTKLEQGLKDKSLLPRFDQEYAIRSIIAKCSDQKFYAKVNQKLFEHFQEYGQTHPDRNYSLQKKPLNFLTRIQGAGGSGKTTIMQILLDSLKPKNLLLLAPTEDKLTDLKEGLKTEAKTEEKLVTGLLADFQDLISEFTKTVTNKLTKDVKTGQFGFTYNGITYGFEITVNDQGIVKGITFTDNTMESLRNLITQDFANNFKDHLIILDENSNIDQLSLVLLDTIAEKSGANFITLGDNTQIGTTFISANGVENVYNINSMFMHKIPALSGILRAKNTGIQQDLKLLYSMANSYIGEEVAVTYEADVDSNKIRSKFRTTKLTYKDLMGVRVVEQSESSIDVLAQMAIAEGNGKSFMVIYDGEESTKTKLKTILKQAGFSDSVINKEGTYKTIKSAQGAEADLVYIYGLTSDVTYNEPSINGDIDLQKIYTAVSRGKEFVLVEDAPNTKGLFAAWGVESVQDDGIGPYSDNNEQFKQAMEFRLTEVTNIKNALSPTISQQEEKADINEEEDALNDYADPDELKDDELDDIEENDPTSDSDENLKKEIEKHNIIFKNAVKVYGYYNRLGITKEKVQDLSKLITGDEVYNFMESLWNDADNSDKVKDLLGYWNANRHSYASGKTLLEAFILFKTQLLYEPSDDVLYLNIKTKTTQDFSYLKPNNKEELDKIKPGQTLTTVMKQVKFGNKSYFVTVGRVGYNYDDPDFSFSKTVRELAMNYLKERKSKGDVLQHTHKLTFNGPENELRIEYLVDKRKSRDSQYSHAPKYLIPQTGLKLFKIEKNIESNQDLFSDEALKFGRGTITQLKKLGYEVEILSPFKNESEFKTAFNKYRFGDPIDSETFETFSFLYKQKWLKIYPAGTKSNEFNTRLILAQQVKDGTIWDVLKNTQKGITPFHMKIVMRFLSNQWGIGQELFGLSSRFKQGQQVNTGLVNGWITEINQFIDILKAEGKTSEANLVETSVLPYYQAWLDPKKSHFPKAAKLSAELQHILSSEEAKNWMFDYVENLDINSETAITTRVPEAPNFFMNLDEFSVTVEPIDNLAVYVNETTATLEEVYDDQEPIPTPEPKVTPEVKNESEVHSTSVGGLGIRSIIQGGEQKSEIQVATSQIQLEPETKIEPPVELHFLDDADSFGVNAIAVSEVLKAMEEGKLSAKEVAQYLSSKKGTNAFKAFMGMYRKVSDSKLSAIFEELKKCK